jgi:hypothetical protein
MYTCHTSGTPAVLLAENTWAAIPYKLNPDQRYFAVGYFHITGIDMHVRALLTAKGCC